MQEGSRIGGTWRGESAEEIEAYLVGSQRKFVKYRLNIFVLNRVSMECDLGLKSSRLSTLSAVYICV